MVGGVHARKRTRARPADAAPAPPVRPSATRRSVTSAIDRCMIMSTIGACMESLLPRSASPARPHSPFLLALLRTGTGPTPGGEDRARRAGQHPVPPLGPCSQATARSDPPLPNRASADGTYGRSRCSGRLGRPRHRTARPRPGSYPRHRSQPLVRLAGHRDPQPRARGLPGQRRGQLGGVRGSTAPLWVATRTGSRSASRRRWTKEPQQPASWPLPRGMHLELVDPGAEPAPRGALTGEGSAGAESAETYATFATNAELAPFGATEIPALSRAETEREAPALRDGAPLGQPYIGERPRIVTRRGWGADESLREGGFVYTKKVKAAFVHHTASGNNYLFPLPGPSSAIRSIYRYHVVSSGWRDIGYNFLVDKCGNIYEAPAPGCGEDRHGCPHPRFQQRHHGDRGSGSFGKTKPAAAAVTAIARLTAWKLGLSGADPRGKTYLKSGGGNLYRKGKNVRLNVISGHRDGFATECPRGSFCTANSARPDRPRPRTRAAEVCAEPSRTPHCRRRPRTTDCIHWPAESSFGRSRQEAETTGDRSDPPGRGQRHPAAPAHGEHPQADGPGGRCPVPHAPTGAGESGGRRAHRLATSYLAEVFELYFGDGSGLGLHIEYVTEEEPLGTGGAIRNVAARLRSGPDEPIRDLQRRHPVRPGHQGPGGDPRDDLRRGRLPPPHPRRGPTGVRPGPHGRDGPRDGLPGEAPDPQDTPSPTRSTPGRTSSAARSSTRSPPAAGFGWNARPSPSSWPPEPTSRAWWIPPTGWTWAPPRPSTRLRGPRPGPRPLSGGPGPLRGPSRAAHGQGRPRRQADRRHGRRRRRAHRRGRPHHGQHDPVRRGRRTRRRHHGLPHRHPRPHSGERTILSGAVIGDGAVVGPDNELREGVRVWCEAKIPAGALRFSSDQ